MALLALGSRLISAEPCFVLRPEVTNRLFVWRRGYSNPRVRVNTRVDTPAIPQTGLGAGCFFREANFFLCCLSELPRKLTPPLRETTPPP